MVMRKNLVPDSYEKLKKLTRGKGGITKSTISSFIKSLKIPATDKKRLQALTPEKYTGLASKLVDEYELKISVAQEGCGPGGCSDCHGCGA